MSAKKIGEYKNFIYTDACIWAKGRAVAYKTATMAINAVLQRPDGRLIVQHERYLFFGNNPYPQSLGTVTYDFLTGLRLDKTVPEDALKAAPKQNDPDKIAKPSFKDFEAFKP